MNTKIVTRQNAQKTYPLVVYKERGLIWEKLRGMWKNKKPNLVKELKKNRSGWR